MVKVVKGLLAEWGMCSCTVLLDSFVWKLSYHNNTIAIRSSSGDITILNATAGSQTAVLSGHTRAVRYLTFSSDGTSLTSGSDDCTVKLWDLQTGGVVKTFSGHTERVWSVSISPDLATIASGSDDYTICLWNIQTGECYQTIQQQGYVLYVTFSPMDPQHLVSICYNKVWQWSTNGHQIKPPYEGSCIAFSSDGTQLVSYNKAVATVQNSHSGAIVAKLNAADCEVHRCCFSPDGRLVAVAAGKAAYVWDITSPDPHLVGSFIGHTSGITSLVFSSPSCLISASSWQKSVKWWKIGILQTDLVVTDPKSTSFTEATTTLQAKDGITITIHPDDTVKTWDISTGVCKVSFQIPTESPIKRDIQLIDGRLILVWYAQGKINIWDVERGELLFAKAKLNPYLGIINLKISGDGSRIFCLGSLSIQAWSIQTGETVGEAEVAPLSWSRSLTVDDTRVWACCPDLGWYQGWDFGIPGSLPVQLPNVPPYMLHPNGAVLWDTSLSRVKDNITGKVVFQLTKRDKKPVDVQWNGQFLVVCYTPEDILILDFSYLFLQ